MGVQAAATSICIHQDELLTVALCSFDVPPSRKLEAGTYYFFTVNDQDWAIKRSVKHAFECCAYRLPPIKGHSGGYRALLKTKLKALGYWESELPDV